MPEKVSQKTNSSKTWNHHPPLPLRDHPYWLWPPKPRIISGWLLENFLTSSDRAVYIAYSILIAVWLMPFADHEALLSLDWISQIFIRNFFAVLIVVGGLHYWFYGIDGQGNILRFDARPITGQKNSLFKFGYQTWDNMFYTLAYGVPLASFWEVFIRFSYAKGWTHFLGFFENPVLFVLLFPIISVLQGIHFYFIHRLLHWPPLYKRFHSVHHRNVNMGPWSGMSMHPFEHLIWFSSMLMFFILPAHPVHIMFLLHWQMLGAPSSHSGYEAIFAKDKARLLVGGFFHQLHHRYFECNYGNNEFPLDKWFGTYHDGTEEMTIKIRKRKRAMHKR